ncbi:hypothetical protein [Deinococcus aestuarii]|uniref:hypothetical protein n=1 Tax=Deinococcus aestuarii TaxID=2774531 RepID=UPI001C0BA03F|nr:hypothetical protein [Deinococcus aestuarii]
MTKVLAGKLAAVGANGRVNDVLCAPLSVLYDDMREDLARATGGTTLETAINAKGTGNLSHPGAAPFVPHRLIHDAHHRGQALPALKVGGFPLSCGLVELLRRAVPVPGEDALWGPLRGE